MKLMRPVIADQWRGVRPDESSTSQVVEMGACGGEYGADTSAKNDVGISGKLEPGAI